LNFGSRLAFTINAFLAINNSSPYRDEIARRILRLQPEDKSPEVQRT
jgi:hypothetical protein